MFYIIRFIYLEPSQKTKRNKKVLKEVVGRGKIK